MLRGGGGDSLSMPFAYQFGSDVYIHDVIFNKGDKTVTQPVVVGRTKQHMPHKERYEANNGGGEYCDAIDQALRKRRGKDKPDRETRAVKSKKNGQDNTVFAGYKEILFY